MKQKGREYWITLIQKVLKSRYLIRWHWDTFIEYHNWDNILDKVHIGPGKVLGYFLFKLISWDRFSLIDFSNLGLGMVLSNFSSPSLHL